MKISDYTFKEPQQYASMMQFHTKKDASQYIKADLGSLYSAVKVSYGIFVTWHIVKRLTNKMIRNDGVECEYTQQPWRVVLKDYDNRETTYRRFDRSSAERLLQERLGETLESRKALAMLYRNAEIYNGSQSMIFGADLSVYV